jgi:hypothetical protein
MVTRPEGHAAGPNASERAENGISVDPTAAPLLVCEREWVARINALEIMVEELIDGLDSEGHTHAVALFRARLRDLTEDSE